MYYVCHVFWFNMEVQMTFLTYTFELQLIFWACSELIDATCVREKHEQHVRSIWGCLVWAWHQKWNELIFCNIWTQNLYRWEHNDSWLIQLHCGLFANIINVIFIASKFWICYRATISLNLVQSLKILAHCVSWQTEDSDASKTLLEELYLHKIINATI